MAEEIMTAPALGDSSQTPAPSPEQPHAGFHEMSREERRDFLSSGKAPQRDTTSDVSADSSPAPAEGQPAAETAAKPKAASEPAEPARERKGKGVKERNAELDAEIAAMHERLRIRQELQRHLEALEKPKQVEKVTDATAAAEPEWKKFRAMKDAPKAEDFESLDDYVAAMGHFVARHTAKAEAESVLGERQQQSTEQLHAQREMDRVISQATERLSADESADPTLKDRIDPSLKRLVPARLLPDGQAVGPQHYVKDWLTFESEHPGVMHAFYSTPEGQQEWGELMRLGRAQIDRALIARELRLTQGLAGPKPGAEKPAPKTFTKTPAPPERGGGKSAAVTDGADAAVKAGDFAAFNAAMDAREGTGRRFGRREARS